MNNRFKLIASGYLFFIKEEKILLLRRLHTGYEDGKYSVPAGHLEEHETIRNTAIREAKEEVGVEISSLDLKLVHIMHRTHLDERIDFFFVPEKWSGILTNTEPEKCDDLSWFPLDKLPENIIPYIKEAIIAYRNNQLYSEFGWI